MTQTQTFGKDCRYIRGRFLKKGASGKVYEAHITERGNFTGEDVVAVKIVDVSEELAHITVRWERFERRLKNILDFRHDHLVAYHKLSVTKEPGLLSYELIMDYYNEGDLALHLESMRGGNKSSHEMSIMCYAMQLTDGLDFLHQHNIIHGDLKPQNVLVKRTQSSHCVLAIGDLDEHVQMNRSITTSGDISSAKGTFWYMSPEMLKKCRECTSDPKIIGRKTDIWSLGCVMLDLVKARNGDTERWLVNRLTGIRKQVGNTFMVLDLVPNGWMPYLPESVPDFLSDCIQECLADISDNRISTTILLKQLKERFKMIIRKSPDSIAVIEGCVCRKSIEDIQAVQPESGSPVVRDAYNDHRGHNLIKGPTQLGGIGIRNPNASVGTEYNFTESVSEPKSRNRNSWLERNNILRNRNRNDRRGLFLRMQRTVSKGQKLLLRTVKGCQKYILLLGSVNPDAVDRFAETFRSTNREENIVVLLEPNTSDSAKEEMHTVALKHKDILTVEFGSVFDKNDLKNVLSDDCQCAFFFADESAHSFADEDHCSFLRVHTLKQQYPKTRAIVKVLLFENKERFYGIPSWFKKDKVETTNGGKTILHQADRVVCTSEIRFAMLAQQYFASGISGVVTGWFDQSNGQTVRSLTIGAAQADQCSRASANRRDSPDQILTARPNRRPAAGRKESFEFNIQPQRRSSITVIPPQPVNVTYKEARVGFESQAVLFAVLQDGEYHLHPRDNLILQPGAKLFFLTTLSSIQLKKKAKELCLDINERCTLAASPAKSKELRLTARIQSVEQGGSGDVVCDVTGQYWRHLLLPPAEIPVKFPNEMKRLQLELKQHVVVCVVSDRKPKPIGLIDLIKPMRAVHIQSPTVIVLAESDFLAVEYPSLSDLPDVHFVKGDPLNDNHLDAINVQGCRMCIVVDASERPQEQSIKWQPQLSGADLWPILPKHFLRHVNAVLATVSVANFLNRIRGIYRPLVLPEQILTCIHHEPVELIACNQAEKKTTGRPKVTPDCKSPRFIDALMLQCYEDKDIFDAVRMLLVNGYRDVSRASSTRSFRGCEFIGNQCKLGKMTFVKDGNQQGLSYCRNKSSGDAYSYRNIDVPIDIDDSAENDKFNQLYGQAADRGLLIIGTQPAMPMDGLSSPLLTGHYEYFVLERPFFVTERQELFDTVKHSLYGCSSKESRDIMCALEFLPAFILKAVEEGSNGLPTIFRPYNCERDSHPKWFLVYYRIVAELYADCSYTTSDFERFPIVDRDIYRLLTLPLPTYDNLNLPKLPGAILTYVLHIYHRNYTRLPPVKSITPAGTFFYGIEGENYAADVKRSLQWKHLAAEHLNWKQLACGDRA